MRSIAEKDLGTPKSLSARTVSLTIDGREVNVPAGTSVLRAASELGIQIPKLCATELLDAFGSCRLCLVQIEGVRGFPASCTTPVAEGMKVTTQNAKVAEIRRGVMELYISDHPLDCLTCPANGHCELQDMAGAVGLREVRYGYDGANHVYAEQKQPVPRGFGQIEAKLVQQRPAQPWPKALARHAGQRAVARWERRRAGSAAG